MCIAEHLQGLLWIINFPILPPNDPCYDDPLGIRIVTLVRVSCMIFQVLYPDSLVRLVCYNILKFVPFSDVGNTPKLREQNNDLWYFSIKFSTGFSVLPESAILFLTHSQL